MGLTERHWFEDEEEARRWLEEEKEKKMVVYDAHFEEYDYLTGAHVEYEKDLGLYKTKESALLAIQRYRDEYEDVYDWDNCMLSIDVREVLD